MKNKKIIFLVATVCCLAVCWFCFGAWTIADTTYQLSDFQYSKSTAYLFIVPSANIPTTEYSNIQISGVYTNPGSSSTVQTSGFTGLLSRFSTNNSSLYFKSSTSFSTNRAVRIDVGVSSVDTSIGNYVITGSYIVDDTPSLVSSPSYRVFSNYSYAQIGASQYRTLILFIDKLPSGGISQDEYDYVVEQLDEQRLLNDQLSNDNLTLQQDLNDMTNDRNSWYNYAQGLEDDYDELHAENFRLNNQLNQLDLQYTNLLNDYDALYAQVGGLDFISLAFDKVGNILQIEILPNITIGTIVAIPLILGVVFLVLRLIRGE